MLPKCKNLASHIFGKQLLTVHSLWNSSNYLDNIFVYAFSLKLVQEEQWEKEKEGMVKGETKGKTDVTLYCQVRLLYKVVKKNV